MLFASGLAYTAIDARDEARDQRREAEGLIGFMLGDLRDKLEPIGRLDVLDAVGARALAYYEKPGQVGPVRRRAGPAVEGADADGRNGGVTRGDLDGALRRYREAMAEHGRGGAPRARQAAAPVRPCPERLLGRLCRLSAGNLDKAAAAFRGISAAGRPDDRAGARRSRDIGWSASMPTPTSARC